jgi:hypothetical protein
VKARTICSGGVVFLLALCLTACGGSASSSASNSTAAFTAAANRLCAMFYAKAQALPAPVGAVQLAAYPHRQQTIRERELVALRRVRPPAERHSTYARFLANLGAIDALHAESIKRLRVPDASRVVAALIERAARLEAKLRAEAQAIALNACARDPYSATQFVHSEGTSGP